MLEVTMASHIGARHQQQDVMAVWQHRDGIVAILADGMSRPDGGLRAATVAVDAAWKTIRRRRIYSPVQCFSTFQAAVSAASTAVSRHEGGTTLLMAVARSQQWCAMGVGDSKVWNATEYGIMPIGTRHGLPAGLTSHVPHVESIWFEVDTNPAGTLILASDGVTSLDSVGSAGDIVRRQIGLGRPRQDNVSVIVIPLGFSAYTVRVDS